MFKSLKMIFCIFQVISIFYTVAAAAGNSKDVNVKGIVNDLIENWEPPFSYLKSRGYLAEDLPSAPVLQDFQQMLQGNSGQELSLEKDSKRGLDKKEKKCGSRTYRSSDDNPEHQELKNMFRNLFKSEGEHASKKLKSKLNVDWDMNALKNAAHQGAENYLKSFKKPINQKDLEEEPFSNKQVKQTDPEEEDPLLNKPDKQTDPEEEEDPGKQIDLEEEPFLKKPLAQDRKEHLARDAPLKQAVPYDGRRFPNDLPRMLKRLATWKPKKESKAVNQVKYF